MRRPPFLGWVPLATVPQRQRYYGGATTPDTASLGLIGSPSGTMWACAVRGVAPRAPDAPQVRASGRGLVTMPVAPPTGSLPHGRCRVSQVSWRAIPWLCLRSSTPDDPWRLAVGGASGAAPTLTTMKASSLRISRLISGALPPAVYASRRALRLCCKLGEGAMRDQGASCSPYDSALARRSCSHAMASVRAHGQRSKARSTIRASPTMPPWRANIPAWPLRSARITSKPLIVA